MSRPYTNAELATQCGATQKHVKRVLAGERRDARVEKHLTRCLGIEFEPLPDLPTVKPTRWQQFNEMNDA